MKLELRRSRNTGDQTFGRLLREDGTRICYVLEDVVREVPGQPVAAWKVPGRTAIPVGTYRVVLENSPRFGPDTLTLKDVPGFTFIRMHAGNTEHDTEGCLLLGFDITPGGAGVKAGIVGGTSRPAVARVKGEVKHAISRGSEVWLTVRNPA